MIYKCTAFFLLLLAYCYGDYYSPFQLRIEPGPSVKATKGAIWPKPQQQINYDEYLVVQPNNFKFTVTNYSCDILESALERYTVTLRKHDRIRRQIKSIFNKNIKRRNEFFGKYFAGSLDSLEIQLLAPCEDIPHLQMDEHYELRINSPDLPQKGLLTSNSMWGILRGLESWSQLLYISDQGSALVINSTSIMDFPRFSHRGLLLDTSRHYMPMRIIFLMLDAMEMNKLNVFHWHIVDHQSFPYESTSFPNLWKGAYSPAHVYTQEDVQKVIEYALFRGIRVIPEFDTPGHTRSWGVGHPDLLTTCYKDSGEPDGTLGPINPIQNASYDFMSTLLSELRSVFKDDYIHLGGDEVEYEIQCWEGNPEIAEYMNKTEQTASQLEGEWMKKIVDIATDLNIKSMVWQEVIDHGGEPPLHTVVQIWKGGHILELAKITNKGYNAILSSCWYLDHLESGGDWLQFYRCDPYVFPGTAEQKAKVMGGEVCMWAEVVDANNVIPRVWPRASAAAEKLWSDGSVINENDAAKRLEEHVCRMNRRGIQAQPPNGPGFCIDVNYSFS